MTLRIKFATLASLIATLLLVLSAICIKVLYHDFSTKEWMSILPAASMFIVLFFVFLSAINYFFARTLLKPLQKLVHQIDSVSNTNLISDTNHDELEILELGLNAISDRMKEQHHDICQINEQLKKANEDMKMLLTNTISALVKSVYARDPYTASHSENVKRYASAVARKLNLNEEEIFYIEIGALLHDIGKIGVPEHILKKPGKLTDSEFDAIKKHPEFGYQIVNEISELKDHGVINIVLFHHERIDGKGYPYGLTGDQIPLHVKIVSVCDAFDAMTTSRSYRPALDPDTAIEQLKMHAGTQFDEQIVSALIECIRENPDLLKHSGASGENRLAL